MKTLLFLLFFFMLPLSLFAQEFGAVRTLISCPAGEESYFNIFIEGTDRGVSASAGEEVTITKVPVGRQMLVVSAIGFETLKRSIEVAEGATLKLELKVQPSALDFDEVVVSATRTGMSRKDAPVLVSLLSSEDFEAAQAVCLSEGLNYQPGLRVETDCQTCNYTQLRMNGLAGGYSQILINSRPIFSALNGLYALEQFPANMIERVEVVRGGGSALYGSSAIAGTVNIITRDPERNSLGVSVNQALIGGRAGDNVIDVNTSVVNESGRAGITLYGTRRSRQEFDANDDGFSEIPRIANYSFGLNSFWRTGEGSRLGLTLQSINEDRDGGDQLDLPPHQRLQSENRASRIFSGTLDWTRDWSGGRQLMAYGGGQFTRRRHYTGVYFSDGYGTTTNYTLQGGLQYSDRLEQFWLGANTLTGGIEYQAEDIFDEIPAYNYLVDQTTRQLGLFLQSDWEVLPDLRLLLGGRLNTHNLVDRPVITPRAGLVYELQEYTRLRASYARGFRAPQAFDTDLHIAFAGGGIATIQMDPELQPEFSDSYSFSVDFDKPSASSIFGFTLSGFYTRLFDAFVLEERETDAEGNLRLQKRNGGDASVYGLTLEARANLDNFVEFNTGFTLQRSLYDEPFTWSADVPGSRNYLRTPDHYGFFTVTFFNNKPLKTYLTGTYTGPMLVPHFGGAPGVPEDRLETSPQFWETNVKISYDWTLPGLKQQIRFFGGVQNIFDAYQSDFDTGPNRDSNYVYGPARPRTYYLGVKLTWNANLPVRK